MPECRNAGADDRTEDRFVAQPFTARLAGKVIAHERIASRQRAGFCQAESDPRQQNPVKIFEQERRHSARHEHAEGHENQAPPSPSVGQDSSATPITTNSTAPTMAMVMYWRRR